MRYLTLSEVLELHRRVIEQSGGANGVRDLAGVESAIVQPQMTFGGDELYPSLIDKAAALCLSLAINHPFVDGNKRIGQSAMETFLVLNRNELNGDIDDADSLFLKLAAGDVERGELNDIDANVSIQELLRLAAQFAATTTRSLPSRHNRLQSRVFAHMPNRNIMHYQPRWRAFVAAFWIVVSCFFATEIRADATLPSPSFDEHIKPILRQRCLKCHGDDKQEADLNLQTFGSLLRGGSGGKVVEAGRSSQSELYRAITNPDEAARMPPNSPPLTKAEVESIRKWIDGGLRESIDSKSMVKGRDLTFKPRVDAADKPQGPPAMPTALPAVKIPKLSRPFPILAIDASPWAPLLAVADQDQVRFVHSETEKELGQVAFPEGDPHVIRFSRDGAVVMVAGGRPVESGRVVLFDVATGKRLAEIGDEIDTVMAAALSPNQRRAALGGSGRIVKVYSTTDGALQYKLTKHTDWITAIAFSPDGKRIATGDRAGGIHLWDTDSGGIVLNLAEHKAAVRALDWRGDSRILASAGEDGRVIWWDVVDGFPAINKQNAHPPTRPPGTYGTIPNGVLDARFDAAGNLATSGRDGVVRVWNVDGNEQKRYKIETGFPVSNVFTNQGKTVISGDSTGKMMFWKR